MTGTRRLFQRALAALYTLAVLATPVLALAQARQPMNDEPPGGRPGPADDGTSGMTWLIVLVAAAAILWLISRRRRSHTIRSP